MKQRFFGKQRLKGSKLLFTMSISQDRLNDIIEESPARLSRLAVESGNVIFGRGSLSVAESIGGWGSTPFA